MVANPVRLPMALVALREARPAKGVVGAGGGGDAFDVGIAGKDKGDKSKSVSTSESLMRSTSFRRFRVLLAGGG